MKKYSVTMLLCSLIVFISMGAKNLPKKSAGDPLSEQESTFIKGECTRIVKDYYSSLSVLKGENIKGAENTQDSTSADDKRKIIASTKYEYFRNSQVLIEKNIPSIAQDKLDVDDYLKNISFLSDEIEGIDCGDDVVVSDIYYDNSQHFYYIVASTDQIITQSDSKIVKSKIDVYFNFDPANNLNPKIYSIQNHRQGVLKDREPIKIVPDNEAEKTLANNSPYFVFDINPSNADINVDGISIFNDGKKIGTTPGVHSIEILAANYQDLKFQVMAGDTGVQQIARTLTPKQGYLTINSPDSSLKQVDVYIDSDTVGNFPLADYQLNVGAHNIALKGKNNFYKSYHVTITDQNLTTLNIDAGSNARWNEKRNNFSSEAPAGVSFQVFYDALSPYGQWVEDPQYGNVWVPNNVSSDFRPYYSDGHWAMTDYGNTWISDEAWGWACYHYGRWTYNSYYNWVWIPGYDWAPAWVTWRSGNDVCGWAPLSPGLNAGVSNGCPDSWWVFVGTANLYSPGYSNYWHGPQNNRAYIQQTSTVSVVININSTHVRYNGGPTTNYIEKTTHRQINQYKIFDAATPGSTIENNNTIRFYRPNLNNPPSSNSYLRPLSVVHATHPINKPQEITATNKQPVFRQDMQAGRLQKQQYYNLPPQQSVYRPQQPTNFNSQQNINHMPQEQNETRLQPTTLNTQQNVNHMPQGLNVNRPTNQNVQQNLNHMPLGQPANPQQNVNHMPQEQTVNNQQQVSNPNPIQGANRQQEQVPVTGTPAQKPKSFFQRIVSTPQQQPNATQKKPLFSLPASKSVKPAKKTR